jgi:hypothetical protein
LTAALVRFELTTATFGAVVCSLCGVVECALYGRKMLGSTFEQAHAYVRKLPRDRVLIVSRFPCPRGCSPCDDGG